MKQAVSSNFGVEAIMFPIISFLYILQTKILTDQVRKLATY